MTEAPATDLNADGDLTADEISEQKAVRLAKRERLIAEYPAFMERYAARWEQQTAGPPA